MNGKIYKIKEKKLELTINPEIRADILSNDVCYTDSEGTKHFKRITISNSFDERFFVKGLD